MNITESFQIFLKNITIDNADQISLRYEEVTRSLNKHFRDSESKTANSLQVGSYGRWTAIKGISDLDMIYIIPNSLWDKYKDKQSILLSDTKKAIKNRYPTTTVSVDKLVVTVQYTNFQIEIQPVFEQDDGSFKYPDTYDGGTWKITRPREEILEIKKMNDATNRNLRRLSKMVRSWSNENSLNIGGLLIDTLCYNFFNQNKEYNEKSYFYYDRLCRDFFYYLANQPDQSYYFAPGSNQKVNVKNKFQKKARHAYDTCKLAISDSDNKYWKEIFGKAFPKLNEDSESQASSRYDKTEQFIEDIFSVDIRYNLQIDCDVSQNGFREHSLAAMIQNKLPLRANKRLDFFITDISVPLPYEIRWKILNKGVEAEKRNCIRGQILNDTGHNKCREETIFQGEHLVECYAIKNNVVVAKSKIDVPIR